MVKKTCIAVFKIDDEVLRVNESVNVLRMWFYFRKCATACVFNCVQLNIYNSVIAVYIYWKELADM